MHIRKASENDIANIAPILKSLDFGSVKVSSPDHIKRKMEKGEWYVLEENHHIKAVIALEVSGHSCEIYAIASTIKGGGGELIKHAIKICKERNIPKLWCWSMARYKVEGFYKKMGFEEQYLLKKHLYNEDCWICGKQINET